MTSVLQGLLEDGWAVTVLAKSRTRALLQRTYPQVQWIEFDAPWTPLYGKYRLWRWPWKEFSRVLRELRSGGFDAVLSIRKDPREHLLLWLAGVPRRIGFTTVWTRWFLNCPVPVDRPEAHRVEDWWEIQQRLSDTVQPFAPRITANPEFVERYRNLFAPDSRPVLAIHCGARIALRRWPVSHFRDLMLRLRQEFNFQIVLIPDLDDYGSELRDLADHMFTGLTLDELVSLLSSVNHLICNDSGPSHLADALGIPVTTLFGPGSPQKIRPFQPRNLVVIRNNCPYHPCSDYCRFPEPYCLTQMTTDMVWPEIREHLAEAARSTLLDLSKESKG